MDVTSPLSIGHQLFKFNKFGICMKCSVDYIRDCRKIPKADFWAVLLFVGSKPSLSVVMICVKAFRSLSKSALLTLIHTFSLEILIPHIVVI